MYLQECRDRGIPIVTVVNKMEVDLVDQYLSKADWKINENSNMDYSLQGLNNYISSEVSKVYWPVADRKPNDTGLSRKHIFESINGSLKRIGTDYLDLYMAHRCGFTRKVRPTSLRSIV